jgi:23S rRNA (cytosine1962-C5)-methyltransferase
LLENGDVLIRKRGVDRIRRGHLWVYRSDIQDDRDTASGAITRVRDERGVVIAKAFYSSQSQIAIRLLVRGDRLIDEAFFRHRFAAADRLREKLGIDPQLSRRIFSEGDFLPGLIVDRYVDRLVVQSLIQSTDRLQPMFHEILSERYQPKSILLRNDSRVRELEGLPLKQEVLGEPLPDPLLINEDGKEFAVTLSTGQKTGSYLDQRENHQAARKYAFGRALDAFTYTGGFAIHVSDVCERVEAVDISESAVEIARSNVERNGLTNVECIEANAFDYLRQQFTDGVRYDTIILDPPAFAKNKESLEGAMRGYKEINNRAMRLLRSGGILITCSCSHHMTESIFAEMLADAAKDAGCWIRVLERRMQASDHPILLAVPETLYLKCFILQVLN